MTLKPLPLNTNYQFTRFRPRTLNLRPNTVGGYIQFPCAVEFASFAAPTTSSNTSINADAPDSRSIWFKPDGTKMFVLNSGTADLVVEYTLSTAWDPTTKGTASTFSVASQTTSPASLAFNAAGTKMYIGGTVTVYEYTLSAWDVTTATHASSDLDVTSEVDSGAVTGLNFNGDGTKLYVMGQANDKIYQYSLSPAYDVSTASYDSKLFDTSGEDADTRDFDFNADLSKLFCIGLNENTVFEYNLLTAGDISTAVYANEFATGLSTTVGGFRFGDSGAKFFVTYVDSTDMVGTYTVSPSYSLATGGTERGSIDMGGVVYAVIGTALIEIQSDGNIVSHGTISGTQRCVLDTDGTQLVIANGANPYVYTVASGLAEITDANLSTSNTTAYLDNKFFYEESGGIITASAFGDASDIAGTDKVNAESFTDGITRLLSDNRFLYAFGTETTEIYRFTGEGNTGLGRQRVHDKLGIIGRYAAAVGEQGIYIINQNRHLVRLIGIQYGLIHNPGFADAVSGYTTVSDCIMSVYTIEQQTFVEMTFPSADATWVYHEESGEFLEREWSSARYRVSSYVSAFGELLGIDRANGKIYQFDEDTYQDDGDSVTRTKDVYFSAEVFGKPISDVTLNDTRLRADSSASASVSVSTSSDLTSFGTARTMTVNGTGVYRAGGPAWGEFAEGMIRYSTSANARVDFLNSAVDVDFSVG